MKVITEKGILTMMFDTREERNAFYFILRSMYFSIVSLLEEYSEPISEALKITMGKEIYKEIIKMGNYYVNLAQFHYQLKEILKERY